MAGGGLLRGYVQHDPAVRAYFAADHRPDVVPARNGDGLHRITAPRDMVQAKSRRRLCETRLRRVPRLARAVARRAARGRGRGAAALGAIAPRCDPLT